MGAPGTTLVSRRPQVFGTLWGLAALLHLAGNPRPSFVEGTLLSTGAALALGVTAVAVVHRPSSQPRLAALCALVLATAYLEAPVVGNHWVLAAAVSAAFLMACASSSWGTRDRNLATWRYFAPTARLIVLTAYGFAAFAKLNSDFFNPAVSCAVYYHDQILSSWGLGAFTVTGVPGPGRLVALGAAATELSVPLLLSNHRTRRWAVCLALTFHGVIALDLAQHFWDFTTVLAACFLLFADDEALERLLRYTEMSKSVIRPAIQRALGLGGLLAALLATAAGVSQGGSTGAHLGLLVGHLAWWLLGPIAIGAFLFATWTTRRAVVPRAPMLRVPHSALLVLPALVAFNGLTPYLELKTGFGWNMYSNLRTVAGQSNHLLVRRTLPLSDLQSDTVTVLAASDPGLHELIGRRYDLVYSEFREYLAAHPEEFVTYRHQGEVKRTTPTTNATNATNPSGLSVKLQAYRPVDRSPEERCVPAFTPAR